MNHNCLVMASEVRRVLVHTSCFWCTPVQNEEKGAAILYTEVRECNKGNLHCCIISEDHMTRLSHMTSGAGGTDPSGICNAALHSLFGYTRQHLQLTNYDVLGVTLLVNNKTPDICIAFAVRLIILMHTRIIYISQIISVISVMHTKYNRHIVLHRRYFKIKR